MTALTYAAATWLGFNLGLIAAALHAYRAEQPIPAEKWDACVTHDRTVRDLLIRAKAALRTCDYGDEDFAEWGRELMFEEEL